MAGRARVVVGSRGWARGCRVAGTAAPRHQLPHCRQGTRRGRSHSLAHRSERTRPRQWPRATRPRRHLQRRCPHRAQTTQQGAARKHQNKVAARAAKQAQYQTYPRPPRRARTARSGRGRTRACSRLWRAFLGAQSQVQRLLLRVACLSLWGRTILMRRALLSLVTGSHHRTLQAARPRH